MKMANKVYPSDISREQFETIRAMLENARKKTNRRRVDLYVRIYLGQDAVRNPAAALLAVGGAPPAHPGVRIASPGCAQVIPTAEEQSTCCIPVYAHHHALTY